MEILELTFFKITNNVSRMDSYILVNGSLAFDFIMDFPGKFSEHIDPTKLHILNISFLVSDLKKQKGGTGGNICFNLGLLKIKNSIFASAGSDFSDYMDLLNSSGVDTSNLKIIQDDLTAQAHITTDLDDNQITAFYPGVMPKTKELSVKNLQEKPMFMVISPNDPEAMMKFVLECQELNIPYMFDPGMQLPRLSDEEIKVGTYSADILIGNDYEMGIILKRLKVSENEILKSVKVLITTLGAEGSVIKTRDQEIKINPAKPKQVLDPTGAGDAYRAGFIAGMVKKFNLKTCAQMGSIASCYAVENYGTTNHKFSLNEFVQRYEENFGEKISL